MRTPNGAQQQGVATPAGAEAGETAFPITIGSPDPADQPTTITNVLRRGTSEIDVVRGTAKVHYLLDGKRTGPPPLRIERPYLELGGEYLTPGAVGRLCCGLYPNRRHPVSRDAFDRLIAAEIPVPA